MLATRFGVDDEDSASRICLAPGGEQRRRQLHLARPRLGIPLGIPGQQRLGPGEAVTNLLGDGGELADRVLIEPDREAAFTKGNHEWQHLLGVRPTIANEQIEV
jgi:hypothetical protein